MLPFFSARFPLRLECWIASLCALGTCGLAARPCLAQTREPLAISAPALPRGAVARFGAEHDGQPSHAIHGLQFSPNGKLLASRNRDQLVQVWNVPSGTSRYTLDDQEGDAVDFAFSPDGKYLVTGSKSVTDPVRIRDAQTGTLRSKILAPALELRFCHDGRLAVVNPSSITFYDTATAQPNHILTPRLQRGTEFVSLSPNGKDLIASTPTRGLPSLLLHDVSTGGVRPLPGSSESLKFATFRPDGHLVAVGTWPGENPNFRVQLLDLQGIGKDRFLDGHGDVVEDLVFSSDQRFAVTVSWDGTARIWELLTGKTIRSLQATQAPSLLPNLDAELVPQFGMGRRRAWNTSHVIAVAVSEDGRWLATGAAGQRDNSVLLWPFHSLILQDADPQAAEPRRPVPHSDGIANEGIANEGQRPAALWKRMASEHPGDAYAAVGSILSRPEALAYVARRLKALATPISTEEVAQLIRDLDHDQFDVREAAFRRLVRTRVAAERQLRAALSGATSLEQRLRIQRLLTQELPNYAIPPERRRRLFRLVFLLEILGNERAHELLTDLATGNPDRQVIGAAQAAMARIAHSKTDAGS